MEVINMNKKAELFQKYLDERQIKAFQVQELKDAGQDTVIFNSRIAVDGQELPTLLITDNSIYSLIRVRVANAAMKEGNETELRKAIDQLNSRFKVFKYYFIDDGALILDVAIVSKPDEINGDMVYTLFDVIIKHLQEEYKNLMKTIWA